MALQGRSEGGTSEKVPWQAAAVPNGQLLGSQGFGLGPASAADYQRQTESLLFQAAAANGEGARVAHPGISSGAAGGGFLHGNGVYSGGGGGGGIYAGGGGGGIHVGGGGGRIKEEVVAATAARAGNLFAGSPLLYQCGGSFQTNDSPSKVSTPGQSIVADMPTPQQTLKPPQLLTTSTKPVGYAHMFPVPI